VRTGFFEGRNRIDSLISDIYDWGTTAITVHGRSRQQRYSKLADWNYIYQCTNNAPTGLQVLGNGDIFSYCDYNKHMADCPELSTCMIARGALIKPWIFTEIKEQRHWDISSGERLNIFRDFVNFGLEHWGSDTKGMMTWCVLSKFYQCAMKFAVSKPKINYIFRINKMCKICAK
ncbi:tRNA-dihydrouridine(47) synthase [NAD(P)(+)]-like, partial [Phalaenopsis equestris]|uniref:tRNA-dihydrouridine(47) synthase [NAD(P)(+)]-like n=1 Tax=Phalaenopsis equestris TaxID=78828 RepID=UPI0009E3D492